MIDLYFWPTPNGLKLKLFLEEAGLPYREIAVNIGKGEQIADMACYPWIVPHAAHGQDLGQFPDLKRWYDSIAARPATIAAYQGVAAAYQRSTPMSQEERQVLFGQTAATRSAGNAAS